MGTRWHDVVALAVALTFGSEPTRAQTLSTHQVMLDKLTHTQRAVEALMKGDADAIAREANALSRLTEQPGWAVLTTPEYVHFSSAFLNATRDLDAAAREGDLDDAALHYASMVMACYSCHRYLKSARISQIDWLDGGDGQKPPARQPPARPPANPSTPPKAVPKSPPPAPPHPHPGGHPEIYPYPFLFQPGFTYRFPYGLYPYYQYGYPYPWYGYPAFGYSFAIGGSEAASSAEFGTVQFEVTPIETRIFVDGFYAGTIDDLDRGELSLPPGPHHIELQADRYQTVIVDVQVQPNHTLRYRATLKPEGSGS